MRTIKFRGKRTHNQEWVYGYYFFKFYTQQHGILIDASGGVTAGREYEVDPATVGQFTGLVDKNGVEIWEGDIVAWIRENWKVVYYDGAFCLEPNINALELLHLHYPNGYVIGNTYDNPELLK